MKYLKEVFGRRALPEIDAQRIDELAARMKRETVKSVVKKSQEGEEREDGQEVSQGGAALVAKHDQPPPGLREEDAQRRCPLGTSPMRPA
jgi:hypothetical protein